MKDIKPIAPPCKFTSHAFSMTDRKKATLTGVAKVDSASETEIILSTCLGRLVINGSSLQIVKFDDSDGNLALTGNIDAVKYAQAKQSLLKRIFK
ncbi:MAG: YabP/YqfC family sporulation protein [Clostridiales bacterium]|nr:YabP/YqfC family sporulation protein [Clostridiales bacterium]